MMGRKDLKCKTYEALLKLNRANISRRGCSVCTLTHTNRGGKSAEVQIPGVKILQ